MPAIQEGSLLQHLRGSLSASDKPKGSPVTVASLRQLGSASSVRRGLLALVDSGAGAGGSFALTILLANALSREAYGAFVLAYSVYILALGLHTALILEPFSVFGAGMNLRAFRAYAAQVAGGHFVWAGGTSALLLLVAGAIRLGSASPLGPAAAGLALATPAMLTSEIFRRYCYLTDRAAIAALLSLTGSGGLVLIALGLAGSGGLGEFSAYLAIAGGRLIGCLAGVVCLQIPWRVPTLRVNREVLQQHWQYGRWVVITAFVFQAANQGYYWLLAILLSPADVALVRAGQNLITPVDVSLTAISMLLLPRASGLVARGHIREFIQLVVRRGVLTLGATAAAALGLVAVGHPLVHYIYRGKYDEVAVLLPGFALLAVVNGVAGSVNDALKASRRPDLVFLGYLSAAGVVLGGIVLVKTFGAAGAVSGMVLSSSIFLAVLIGALSRTIRRRLQEPSSG